MMDSGYMGAEMVGLSTNPLESFVDALRSQIIGEVKAEMAGDIVERVIHIVSAAVQNLAVHQSFTLTPTVQVAPIQMDPVVVNVPAPMVDVEMNMDDMVREMKLTRECMEKCMMMLASPIERTINRNSDGLIQSVTERHM